jgi:hypothetical protein
MGNPVNKTTPTMTPVKVINTGLEHHGQAGYVVEPPAGDEDTVGVKMDIDNEVYQFAQADIETLV